MSRTQHQQMRDAINDVELALNGLAVNHLVSAWEGADNNVMIKVRLGDIRQLGRCYPELNRIINDPAFVPRARSHKEIAEPQGGDNG